MKKNINTALVFLSLLVSVSSFGAVPETINYQGYLTNADGQPVDQPVEITIAIYNVELGGSPLWSGTYNPAVEQGLFSVELGSPSNPFPNDLFENPVWLGLSVSNDLEMAPRRALAASSYAIESKNAQSLGGFSPSTYDQSSHVTDQNNPHGTTAAQIGAASIQDVSSLQVQIDALNVAIVGSQASLASALDLINTLTTELNAARMDVVALQDALAIETAARISADASNTSDISAIQSNSVLELDGILSKDGDDALFSGINIRVDNGTGQTASSNGLGNIVVGYDLPDTTDSPVCSKGNLFAQSVCEADGGVWSSSHKSGSHNIVVGDRHNYTSTGGMVVGENNNILRSNASAVSGTGNTAVGLSSAVFGGLNNMASGFASVAVGGGDPSSGNWAAGDYSLVAGGALNSTGLCCGEGGIVDPNAPGTSAAVFGGTGNAAYGTFSTISGGWTNSVTGLQASVFGGFVNSADGPGATALGGINNNASGYVSSVTGGSSNTATGNSSSVSGGNSNTSEGESSSVSGGSQRTATGDNDWVAGELFQSN